MEKLEKSIESRESESFVSFGEAMRKLGQAQYSSRFVNPNPKLHDDGTPFFDNIRIEGDPDDYHSLKIHKDDIKKFIERWLEYKKETSPFFNKNAKMEDFYEKI